MLTHDTMQVHLEDMLLEKNQSQKDRCCLALYMISLE